MYESCVSFWSTLFQKRRLLLSWERGVVGLANYYAAWIAIKIEWNLPRTLYFIWVPFASFDEAWLAILFGDHFSKCDNISLLARCLTTVETANVASPETINGYICWPCVPAGFSWHSPQGIRFCHEIIWFLSLRFELLCLHLWKIDGHNINAVVLVIYCRCR